MCRGLTPEEIRALIDGCPHVGLVGDEEQAVGLPEIVLSDDRHLARDSRHVVR